MTTVSVVDCQAYFKHEKMSGKLILVVVEEGLVQPQECLISGVCMRQPKSDYVLAQSAIVSKTEMCSHYRQEVTQ